MLPSVNMPVLGSPYPFGEQELSMLMFRNMYVHAHRLPPGRQTGHRTPQPLARWNHTSTAPLLESRIALLWQWRAPVCRGPGRPRRPFSWSPL